MNVQDKTRDFEILSGSALKVIALLSMACDHTAKFLLAPLGLARKTLFVFAGLKISPLYIMECVIGRLAFPIFAFLIVEGFIHTRNLRRYILNLLAFAVISIVPWNLLHGGLFEFGSFNVLFTFVLGLIALWGIRDLEGWKSFAVVALAFAAAYLMHTDYSVSGPITILLLYGFRGRREYQSLSFTAALFRGKLSAGVPLAAIPVLMYNGRRGFIKGNVGKYFFYAFYPAHLMILYLLANA